MPDADDPEAPEPAQPRSAVLTDAAEQYEAADDADAPEAQERYEPVDDAEGVEAQERYEAVDDADDDAGTAAETEPTEALSQHDQPEATNQPNRPADLDETPPAQQPEVDRPQDLERPQDVARPQDVERPQKVDQPPAAQDTDLDLSRELGTERPPDDLDDAAETEPTEALSQHDQPEATNQSNRPDDLDEPPPSEEPEGERLQDLERPQHLERPQDAARAQEFDQPPAAQEPDLDRPGELGTERPPDDLDDAGTAAQTEPTEALSQHDQPEATNQSNRPSDLDELPPSEEPEGERPQDLERPEEAAQLLYRPGELGTERPPDDLDDAGSAAQTEPTAALSQHDQPETTGQPSRPADFDQPQVAQGPADRPERQPELDRIDEPSPFVNDRLEWSAAADPGEQRDQVARPTERPDPSEAVAALEANTADEAALDVDRAEASAPVDRADNPYVRAVEDASPPGVERAVVPVEATVLPAAVAEPPAEVARRVNPYAVAAEDPGPPPGPDPAQQVERPRELDRITASRLFGIPLQALQALEDFCATWRVTIDIRPTNTDDPEKLAIQGVPKPEVWKDNTVNETDIKYFGASKDNRGLLWIPRELPDKDPSWPAHVQERYDKRAEAMADESKIRLLGEWFSVWNDGVVCDRRSGQPVRGDHDLFDIRWADGRPMSLPAYLGLVAQLRSMKIGIEHGAAVWWESEKKEPLSAKEVAARDRQLAQHGAPAPDDPDRAKAWERPPSEPLLRIEPVNEDRKPWVSPSESSTRRLVIWADRNTAAPPPHLEPEPVAETAPFGVDADDRDTAAVFESLRAELDREEQLEATARAERLEREAAAEEALREQREADSAESENRREQREADAAESENRREQREADDARAEAQRRRRVADVEEDWRERQKP